MLLVIFGAGASFDSYESSQPRLEPGGGRPPLAQDVFDERFRDIIANHSWVHGLVHPLRRLVGTPGALEEHLERMRNDQNPEVAKTLMALRFYLSDLLGRVSRDWMARTGGATNYATLLDILLAWRYRTQKPVTVVTFNYDLLFDQACAGRSLIALSRVASYVTHDFSLVKIHGSASWLRRIGGTDARTAPISNAPKLRLLDEIVTESEASGRDGSLTHPDNGWVPAIAVPTVRKNEFECPGSHLQAARTAMSNVTHLLVVGWRGREENFMHLWQQALAGPSKTLAYVTIVDVEHGAAEDVYRILASAGVLPAYPPTISTDGFSGWLRSEEAARFFTL